MNKTEIEDYTFNFLIQILPLKSVVSTMGNIARESEFNPDLVEVGSGVGFGLCQWSYTRREQLESYGTDIDHQLLFLQDELMGTHNSSTAEFQWINKSGYLSHSDFINGNGSIEELTKAFCFCWERPNYELSHIDERIQCANEYYERYKDYETSSKNSEIIESAVQFMIDIANDDTHGYDQTNRWGNPDYDCSSLVITAYTQAGIDVKGAGATNTRDMKSTFKNMGFEVVVPTDWDDTSQMKKGDVLLNETHHTAMYIGNGKIAHASINENGTATGGQPGDQTGKEICIRNYYVYSYGWDCILRLPAIGGGGSGGGGGGGGGSEEGDIIVTVLKYEKFLSNNLFKQKIFKRGNIELIRQYGDIVTLKIGGVLFNLHKKNVKIEVIEKETEEEENSENT